MVLEASKLIYFLYSLALFSKQRFFENFIKITLAVVLTVLCR